MSFVSFPNYLASVWIETVGLSDQTGFGILLASSWPMQIIKDFEIRSFRSIRHCKIEDLADFSILSGLNNSGKSNFLRALNLFFRGEPEPGVPINLQRDFYRGDLSSKKRKQISVSVHFTLPRLSDSVADSSHWSNI